MRRRPLILPPDLSQRPFNITVERVMPLSAQKVYEAWTQGFDLWFAAPGTLMMDGKVNAPFFFETRFENRRHPHYGRFVSLKRNRLVKLAWVTGDGGTRGAETLVTVEISPSDEGTRVRLTHAGFPDEESRKRHAEAWPIVLEQMEKRLLEKHNTKR